MQIRRAEEHDIPLLTRWDGHIRSAELHHAIQQQRIYLLEVQQQFAGWLRFQLFWDSIPFMNLLYVLEDYRGNGYGKALVTHWEMEMKQFGYSTAMTSTSSQEYAQHFYYQLGYHTIGGFFPHEEPYEILLEKLL
ncbi:MAG: GNAT family N-acetyltransferase [Lachnospiraceae bacterium]|nr:GNAT family N-acetyltransferase [Lachnospiraceae bacterium]